MLHLRQKQALMDRSSVKIEQSLCFGYLHQTPQTNVYDGRTFALS